MLWLILSHLRIKQKHHVHHLKGLPVPPKLSQHQIDSLKDVELYPDDIWGVIPLVVLLGRIRNILAKGDDTRKIDEVLPWLEAANSKVVPHDIDILSLECPRAFKSHMPHHLMPCGLPSNTPCKYIYVTQNLKDAAACYFCHYFTLKRAENFDWETLDKGGGGVDGRSIFHPSSLLTLITIYHQNFKILSEDFSSLNLTSFILIPLYAVYGIYLFSTAGSQLQYGISLAYYHNTCTNYIKTNQSSEMTLISSIPYEYIQDQSIINSGRKNKHG